MRYVVGMLVALALAACTDEPKPVPQESWVILEAPLPRKRQMPVVAEVAWNDGDDPLRVHNIDLMDTLSASAI